MCTLILSAPIGPVITHLRDDVSPETEARQKERAVGMPVWGMPSETHRKKKKREEKSKKSPTTVDILICYEVFVTAVSYAHLKLVIDEHLLRLNYTVSNTENFVKIL